MNCTADRHIWMVGSVGTSPGTPPDGWPCQCGAVKWSTHDELAELQAALDAARLEIADLKSLLHRARIEGGAGHSYTCPVSHYDIPHIAQEEGVPCDCWMVDLRAALQGGAGAEEDER